MVVYPPHQADDQDKIEALINGGLNFPNLVGFKMPVSGDIQLITGSHRLAALEQVGSELVGRIEIVTPTDFNESFDWQGFTAEAIRGGDFNSLVAQAFSACENEKIKELLKEQVIV